VTKMIARTLAAIGLAATLAAHAETPAGDAARGKGVYMKEMCWSCHGTVGQGSQYGPKLAPQPFPWEAFAHQVRTPRSSMPPYTASHLADADLADVYAYVASIKPGKKASDIPLLKD
jgi:ubiquinol-cytochrome c reductase cytochrome c subunit